MTNFRNVKLKVLSPEHSAAFQESAFGAGARWRIGGNKVKRTDAKYLFTSNDDAPVFTWGDSQSEFDANKKRLISFITPAYQMTKIRIRSPEHSEFVQKKLFENGCSWSGGITKTQHADRGFLTISGIGQIRFCSEEFFNKQKHLTEIFIEDDSMDELDEHEKESSNAGPKTTTIGTLGVDIETNVTTRFSGTETSDGSTDGYEKLTDVLQAAHNQAAHGKGKDRHANGQPFHEQRMQAISKLIKSPKGMEFQAIKKLTEGMQFDDHDRREAELLGAINYIAGIVIYFRESKDENQ